MLVDLTIMNPPVYQMDVKEKDVPAKPQSEHAYQLVCRGLPNSDKKFLRTD